MKKICTTIRPLDFGGTVFDELDSYASIIEKAGANAINFNFKYINSDLLALPENYLGMKLKCILDSHGIKTPITHAPFIGNFNFPAQGKLERIEDLKDLILMSLLVSKTLGAHTTVVHSGISFKDDVYNEDRTVQDNVKFYLPICMEAKKLGIKLAIENNVNENRTEVGDIIEPGVNVLNRICDELNNVFKSDVMGICFDVGHSNIATNNPYEELKKTQKNLQTLHIHNNMGLIDANHVWESDMHSALSLGKIDNARIFDILNEMDFKKDVVIESIYRGDKENIGYHIINDNTFAKTHYESFKQSEEVMEDD